MNENNNETLEQKLIDLNHLLSKPGTCSCGGQFKYQGLGIYKCAMCGNVFKDEYGKVREFVDEYGTNYNILEISQKTGVSRTLINMFIKDKRFDMVKTQRRCVNCKTPIDKGDYCKKCALIQIQDGIDKDRKSNIIGSLAKGNNMSGKMHFIKKD